MSEPDWSVHLLQLSARGELGRASSSLFLDLPALSQPWSCETRCCTPGLRDRDARSCCADLEVPVTPAERRALDAAHDEIAAFYAEQDPRWKGAPPPFFAGDTLQRAGRRCIFALLGPDGLSCGLHSLEDQTGRQRGALKPLPCRLFPLVQVEIDPQRSLLSAVSRRTARLAQTRPARSFFCIGAAGAPPLAHANTDTLTALYGARLTRTITRAVDDWIATRA